MVTKSELRRELQLERMIAILDDHVAEYGIDIEGRIRVYNSWPVDNGHEVIRTVSNYQYRTEQVVETIREVWQALGY